MAETPTLWRSWRHHIEAAGVAAIFALFRALPLDRASALGGFLARHLGPHLGASKRARINLRRALPALSAAAIEAIIRGMWDNLGRVIAEYPHLGEFDVFARDGRVAVSGAEEIRAGGGTGKRYIFFSAHYGNWEIAFMAASQAGLAVAGIYRAANNPLVDRLINQARSRERGRSRDQIGGELIPKGAIAARRAIAALQNGRHLAMLVDQKMNDGIAVPFFGRDAMTAPALARLALRFDCSVVPVRVERLAGAHFRLTCEPPLALPKSGDVQADTRELMMAVNATIERWIRERPEQWFWLHRRWPD